MPSHKPLVLFLCASKTPLLTRSSSGQSHPLSDRDGAMTCRLAVDASFRHCAFRIRSISESIPPLKSRCILSVRALVRQCNASSGISTKVQRMPHRTPHNGHCSQTSLSWTIDGSSVSHFFRSDVHDRTIFLICRRSIDSKLHSDIGSV